MKRIKMMLMAMVAVFAIGAVGASAASAATANTFSASIGGTTWAGDLAPCAFTIDLYDKTSSTPPANIGAGETATAAAASFAGIAPWVDHNNILIQECDNTTVVINNDFDIEWDAVSDLNANVMPPLSITDLTTGCTYTTSNPIPMSSTTDVYGTPASGHPSADHGEWTGTGTATSNDFPCIFAPATLTVDNGLFYTK